MKLRTVISRILLLMVGSLQCLQGTSQPGLPAVFRATGEKYQILQPEKMYIHLDRPTYLVGETIWLKLLVTSENLKFSDLSTIGYIEVIGADKQPVIQAKIALRNGKGDGALQLPPSIPSGYYLVRGYTNWMKNFTESHFFETRICILNPFEATTETVQSSASEDTPKISFFAEGGSAVPETECRIAFKAQGREGLPSEVKGRVLDSGGSEVTTFQSSLNGMGQFLLTPRQGFSYTAQVTWSSGEQLSYPLDIIRSDAYAIKVDEAEKALQVRVVSPQRTSSQPVLLLLYNKKDNPALQTVTEKGIAGFTIPRTRLSPGVNTLVIFDEHLKPVAERLFFQPLPGNPKLTASPEKTSLGKREKISIKLRADALEDTLETSVAVFLSDSLPENTLPSVNAALLLTSDLRGEIENPDQYFRLTGAAQREAMELLMLTHGWRRYKKEDLLSSEFTADYLPEADGHLITGKVVGPDGKSLQPHTSVYAAFPSMKVNPWVAISDKNGRFVLETREFQGPKELVFQTNSRMDSTNKIVVNDPFFPLTESNIRMTFPVIKYIYREDLLKRSINMQAVNSYFPLKRITPAPDSTAFFGKPDFSYYLDDYTRFPTMEEVLSEYVPSVMIRLRKGKYYTRVIETGMHKQVFSEDPLILMDGIPVFDTDRIVRFDPLKVKKLDVVNRLYFLGPMIFPGVVSYSTYSHDLSGFELDSRALIKAYHGTLEKREFYSPTYDQPSKNGRRLPDLRNLLFWAPSVRIAPGQESMIDFYTSDQTGQYRIVAQGLSDNGTPVSTENLIRVSD